METQNSYRGFKELNCWKEGRELRKQIAKIAKMFPVGEQYLLKNKIIRAARSITANIAEGYGGFTYADTRHFFIQARGSVTEVLDHITVADDEEYINDEIGAAVEKQCETVFKLINGYIAYLDRSVKKS